MPFAIGFVRELAAAAAAGVVEQDVDGAVDIGRLTHGALYGFVVANVAGDERGFAAAVANRCGHRLPLIFAPRHQDDFRAFAGKDMPGGLANAAVAAGDDGHLACQSAWHCSLSS